VKDNKTHRRGFTLAELMFVVTIVSVVFVGVIAASCAGPEQKNSAKKEAAQWAKELGIEYSGISCADYDSDNDGYVSCTIATKNGDTKPIECRGAYSIGHGCRDPKLNIRGTSK
jgi:prepilin-type N-terminal cleavage/methylation domain-containing protein